MKLGGKITTGFLVVLGLHIVVAVMGHLGNRRAQSDLQAVDTADTLTRSMLEIDRLVGDVQGSVQGYTFSGNRGLALRSERTFELLEERLRGVGALLPEEDRESIEWMRASLRSYAANFRAAVGDRSRRERLVQQDLSRLVHRGRELLARCRSATVAPRPSGRDLEALLLTAQNGAYRYLAQLDSEAMREARDAVGAIRELLADWPGDREAAEPPLADDYERVLLGLVQSTRGYLHLVHVVMAAEAVEFLRASAELREQALGRSTALREGIEVRQREYELWSALVSLVTIVLGLVAGGLISRQVVLPLQSITSTLSRLTRGERAEIPGLERTDEIGDMAIAAQQLRDRTAEAERLLAETERLSAQRERVIADLERSNQDLDDFARIASHDLKAPLRAIAMIARWLIEDGGDSMSAEVRGQLETLRDRVSRMSRLLRRLHDYSHAGRLEQQNVPVDIRQLVVEAAEVNVGAGFHVRVVGPQQLSIVAAATPIAQVVGNLLTNAAVHHDRASGSITIEIAPIDGGVRISVTDDGPGIDPRFHDRIFEPFETLLPREGCTNTGVGLAIVKKMLERFGARITVQSPVEDGRGTCFEVVWPNAEPVAAGERPELLAEPAHQPA